MRFTLLLPFLSLMGCTTTQTAEEPVDRSSRGYLAAKGWIGRNPEVEFEQNKETERLRFYGIGFHLEDGCEIPGLTQQEVDKYAGAVGIEIIHDDVTPFYVDGPEFKSTHYWAALEDFISTYNRLVLKEIMTMLNAAAVERSLEPVD